MNEVHALTSGSAQGIVRALREPLSFWGGVDSTTGTIIDASHPDCGRSLTGCILVMESGRGSSSSSSVLAEAIRRGTGPVGIILERPDPILVVGALVAKTLYEKSCPLLVCPAHGLVDGDRIAIEAGLTTGTIRRIANDLPNLSAT